MLAGNRSELYGVTGAATPLSHAVSLAPPIHPVNDPITPKAPRTQRGRDSSQSPAYEGTGTYWFWTPAGPQAKQLRVTVSTLWEAAWALIGIPGR